MFNDENLEDIELIKLQIELKENRKRIEDLTEEQKLKLIQMYEKQIKEKNKVLDNLKNEIVDLRKKLNN